MKFQTDEKITKHWIRHCSNGSIFAYKLPNFNPEWAAKLESVVHGFLLFPTQFLLFIHLLLGRMHYRFVYRISVVSTRCIFVPSFRRWPMSASPAATMRTRAIICLTN